MNFRHSTVGSRLRWLLLPAVACWLGSCLPAPYFQKEETIPQQAWNYNYRPKFKVDITDTTADYQPYFIIQHTQSYPYCNMWIWMYVKAPGDSIPRKERLNITLAESTGQWLGRGMGEIWEQRMPITLSDSIRFNRAGTYEISLEQNMRVNPLPEVLHVGFRLEKKEIKGH